MAQLIQCDFCGNITNQIAAQITISVADDRAIRDYVLNQLASQMQTSPEYMDRRMYKDCCKDCLSKFIETKPVPLAITPSGEAVTKTDL